jgi:nitronate monooxygenase
MYPIIQAPMLGVSTPEMAAAVSNEGGLGSLAVGGLSSELTLQLIRKTKSLTNKPFAVNLFAHDIPAITDKEIEPMQKFILQLADKRGYSLSRADLSDFSFHTYHEQVDLLIEEEMRIVSFTFGCLDVKSIELFKQKGAILIGTATSVEEALYLQSQQIDMIAVQGLEAGGHRGSFLENIPLPQLGLFALLPQVTSAVSTPCIAAGGINSAKTIKAAFDLGALAIQVGSAFVGTEESIAVPSYKKKIETSKDTDTVLTRAFSGRWARGIRNEMMTEIENAGIFIPPYPVQNSLTTKLRRLAQQADDGEYTNLWAGQSVGKKEKTLSKQVLMGLIDEYERLHS